MAQAFCFRHQTRKPPGKIWVIISHRVWLFPMTQQLIDPEELADELDISHLVIEDDTPVDLQSQKQQRLLVEPLYSSKVLPTPFLAAANVGLFYKLKGDPIVPDAMLSLGVQRAEDYSQKKNRSYFTWEFGKAPEVCIEIVSNAEGDELALSRKSEQKGRTTSKKYIYAQIGIPYYVVFDPLQYLQGADEMNGALLQVWTISPTGYRELTAEPGISAAGQFVWLEAVGLGLTLWEGQFEEEISRLWLRWCDQEGRVIPTGAEQAERATEQAERAEQRAERATEQAERAEQRAARLAERLRAMGVNPDEI
jgi:Uma2 family endonuclease